MTTIPVGRELLERISDPFTSTAFLLEGLQELRKLLSEQPQAGAGQTPVLVEAVAITKENEDGELYLDWLLEGGICALESAGTLLVVAHGKVTDDEGSGEVFTAPQSAPVVSEAGAGQFDWIVGLIDEECRYWHGAGDEARRSVCANLLASAKAAPQPAARPDQGERLADLLASVRMGDDEAKPHGIGATYWNNAIIACQVAIRDALAAALTQSPKGEEE